MKKMKRRTVAVFSMIFGVVGVHALLYYMNEINKPPQPEARKIAKEFKVEKQKKKKQRERPQQHKQTRKAVSTARRAPMPNISTPMSGLSFDLPQFQTDDLIGTGELLSSADANKRLVMTEDSVDSLPHPRSRTAPQYPAKARQRGIEGHVVLKIKVSERGDVEQVRVVEADPVGVFEDVTIAAVQHWTFDPAKYKGSPVAISVSQRIPFRLN